VHPERPRPLSQPHPPSKTYVRSQTLTNPRTVRNPTTAAGYRALLAWLRGFGILLRVGVEGTGSYGAALTRYLTAQHVGVIEVNRPDRAAAAGAARATPTPPAIAVLSDRATATPKDHTGTVEAIRVLHTTRAGVMKARTAAKNTLNNLIVTAPRPTCVTSYAH
jgi:transposase